MKDKKTPTSEKSRKEVFQPEFHNEPLENDVAMAELVAVIDIGSNAIRMVIAEILGDGSIEILERLQRAVRIGLDTFRRGRIGAMCMRASIEILRDFKSRLDMYEIRRVRAVATSAVREAINADAFVDRVYTATGLNVEIISMSEECRLAYSAVRHSILEHRNQPPVKNGEEKSAGEAVPSAKPSKDDDEMILRRGRTLIVEVGGGSTVLSVLQDGQLVNSQTLRLGAIRLREFLADNWEPAQQQSTILSDHIDNILSGTEAIIPLERIHKMIAIGGDARFAADQVGNPCSRYGLTCVEGELFRELVRSCSHIPIDVLARQFSLPYENAETLVPALLVLQSLLQRTGAEKMHVSNVSMRDGLLLDLALQVSGLEDGSLRQATTQAAWTLAEKFRADPEHAYNVANLSVKLFDTLSAEHGLDSHKRLLLFVAALLHEVGRVVSAQAHHKHSYYLISHSEIFGLSPEEVQMVAQIARYHRRSRPKPSHQDYMSLPREKRVLVSKLAAILRIADALQQGHPYKIEDVKMELAQAASAYRPTSASTARERSRTRTGSRFEHGDELLITLPGVTDTLLEQRALDDTGDLFEDIYGLRIHLTNHT